MGHLKAKPVLDHGAVEDNRHRQRQADPEPLAEHLLVAGMVHVRGAVSKVSPAETADYWSKRPRGSQLGAWASQQSAPIASRAALLGQLAEVTERFAEIDSVPVSPHWGGYLIAPEIVEFWQGRESRVHNRVRVFPSEPAGRPERLQP